METKGLAFPKPEPRSRAKRRARTAESAQVRKVRPIVAARDGHCRAGGAGLGPCTPKSDWAHLGRFKRARTRGQAPELRHTTAGSLMLCGSPPDGHHGAYDAGLLRIRVLTTEGADGPLEFVRGATVYREGSGS